MTTDNCQFLFNIGNNLLQFSVKFISANYWLSILDSLSFCHELDRLRECVGGNENFFQVFMLYYLFSCNYMVDLFCLPFTCLLTVFVSQTRLGNDIFSGSAIYEMARKFNCVKLQYLNRRRILFHWKFQLSFLLSKMIWNGK